MFKNIFKLLVQRYLNSQNFTKNYFALVNVELYDKDLRLMNINIKQIAAVLGINETLTTYAARHSYATIMKHNGAPISIISESMGHQNERITQVYLDSFGNEVLDEVNRLIL